MVDIAVFLSTPSARRATPEHHGGRRRRGISIHALREEGDVRRRVRPFLQRNFYPRPPRGGRLSASKKAWPHSQFLSTPSARRATPAQGSRRVQDEISIHALREEGDRTWFLPVSTPNVFLSTPSARRATCNVDNLVVGLINFYPRPPRGGRPAMNASIKAIELFLSTPSARRATLSRFPASYLQSISIHALREEGDLFMAGLSTFWSLFLSTPSARRATKMAMRSVADFGFLSTPSARRATGHRVRFRVFGPDFYPRPPRGGRPPPGRQRPLGCQISIHALREEGDSKNRDKISIFL